VPDRAGFEAFYAAHLPRLVRDAGRAFYLFVAIGNDAPAALREQTWQVADSLSFLPGDS
jgi:hypothetical protein